MLSCRQAGCVSVQAGRDLATFALTGAWVQADAMTGLLHRKGLDAALPLLQLATIPLTRQS
jgi:hypothetical protein